MLLAKQGQRRLRCVPSAMPNASCCFGTAACALQQQKAAAISRAHPRSVMLKNCPFGGVRPLTPGPCRACLHACVAGPKAMEARRAAQSDIQNIRTPRNDADRFLAPTRRDGAIRPHLGVARPRHTLRMPSGSRLDLQPNRSRRVRENKPK